MKLPCLFDFTAAKAEVSYQKGSDIVLADAKQSQTDEVAALAAKQVKTPNEKQATNRKRQPALEAKMEQLVPGSATKVKERIEELLKADEARKHKPLAPKPPISSDVSPTPPVPTPRKTVGSAPAPTPPVPKPRKTVNAAPGPAPTPPAPKPRQATDQAAATALKKPARRRKPHGPKKTTSTIPTSKQRAPMTQCKYVALKQDCPHKSCRFDHGRK